MVANYRQPKWTSLSQIISSTSICLFFQLRPFGFYFMAIAGQQSTGLLTQTVSGTEMKSAFIHDAFHGDRQSICPQLPLVNHVSSSVENLSLLKHQSQNVCKIIIKEKIIWFRIQSCIHVRPSSAWRTAFKSKADEAPPAVHFHFHWTVTKQHPGQTSSWCVSEM